MKGSWALEKIARTCTNKYTLLRVSLPWNLYIDIPLVFASINYNLPNIQQYEFRNFEFVAQLTADLNNPILLIDCGADIGIISAQLIAAYPNICQAIAFEPNTRSYQYLLHNAALWPIQSTVMNKAVVNYRGRSNLEYPDFDPSNHAAFISKCASGKIEVVKIDDFEFESNYILLKVDVEGGELHTIQGAYKLLKRSKGFVVLFEAHPNHFKRNGIYPMKTLAFLNTIRTCRVQTIEEPNLELDYSRPFWEQTPTKKVYNLCAYSL